MNLKGWEIVVTGGTGGIGRETARALAAMGATVTILGRDQKKGDSLIEDIRRQSQSGSVRFLGCDLSSLTSMQSVAATISKFVPRIDVLVNNAGGYYSSRRVSADGVEMTFALNHLSYYVLTNLLLDKIKASSPARIINVSSRLHLQGVIDFANLEMQRGYDGLKAYNNSKLMNVMFTYALARKLKGTQVTANCLHPGFVASGFGHNNYGLYGLGLRVLQAVAAVPVKKGAETSIYLASSPEVDTVTGKYFVNKKPEASSELSYNMDLQEKLWAVTAKMTGIG